MIFNNICKKRIVRILTIIFCMGVILLNTSCEKTEEVVGNGIEVFLLSPEEDGLVAMPLPFDEAKRYDNDYIMKCMLEQLVNASEAGNLHPVLDEKSGFKSIAKADKQIVADFDENFWKEDPVKATLIRASLTKTFTQLNGVNTVFCTVNGEAMTDTAGNVIGPMSADSFIDNAGAQINAEERTELTLYFANATGDGLIPVTRSVVYSGNISMDKLTVEQLLLGPLEGEKGFPVLNSTQKIINVTTQDGTCYVNLSADFLTPEHNITNDVAIYSIVDSLIELGTINKVQILIDSDSDVMFRESVNLSTQFERNLDLVVK